MEEVAHLRLVAGGPQSGRQFTGCAVVASTHAG
jgi:hypothetical protein